MDHKRHLQELKEKVEDFKRRRIAATECAKKAHEAQVKKIQEAEKAINEFVKARETEREA